METELASQLLSLAAAYAKARGLEESTVGRLCASDGRFFSNIRSGLTFTVRKHDRVVGWFAENWPEGAPWPADVARPAPQRGAAA